MRIDENWLGEMIIRITFLFWNFNDWNLFWMEWNNVFCDLCLFSSQFHIKMNQRLTLQKHLESLFFLVFVQINKIYYMFHIASYHYYPLIEIHSYQGYLNMSLTYEHVLFH